MAGWIKMPPGREIGLSPGDIVLDGDPARPPPTGGRAPNFRPMSIMASTAGWIKMPLGMEVGLGAGHIVLDRDPAPGPSPKGAQLPQFFGRYLLWTNGWMDQDAAW